MGFIDAIIRKFFGTKTERDLKELMPIVHKIKEVYPRFVDLSNDDLRNETAILKQRIRDYIAEEEKMVAEMKAQMETDSVDYEEKERIYNEVDKIVKQIDVKIEEILNEILPEAFSIVKETARRFKENETIVVTANDFDRDLAARKDFVTIEGDKAIYKNRWMAGETRLFGTWFITMFSFLEVLCFIKVKLLRWVQVKVKPLWLHYQSF
jgi:preprotein translocase subunit SecA